MCCTNCMFVTASLLLTLTFVAVGISFFGPYWISNLGKAVNETEYADPQWKSYLPWDRPVLAYPDRGLWAQCGPDCLWFWNDDYKLQKHLLTPLKWHLSTQILYFLAAALILAAELTARIQLCCDEERNTRNYASIGITILVSALIQTTALAVFGAFTADEPYNAVNDPTKYSDYLGQAWNPASNPVEAPYLGWCYWMAVVGDALSVVTGVLFLLAAWCNCCNKAMD